MASVFAALLHGYAHDQLSPKVGAVREYIDKWTAKVERHHQASDDFFEAREQALFMLRYGPRVQWINTCEFSPRSIARELLLANNLSSRRFRKLTAEDYPQEPDWIDYLRRPDTDPTNVRRFYVYLIRRAGRVYSFRQFRESILYVGKGSGGRLNEHEENVSDLSKYKQPYPFLRQQGPLHFEKVFDSLTNYRALSLEAAIIAHLLSVGRCLLSQDGDNPLGNSQLGEEHNFLIAGLELRKLEAVGAAALRNLFF
eukprot:m.49296 g.49296  ORF g.49296 m.49296 type:complete len:255 (+) comp47923_c0_seq2:38-802(+)